MSNALLPCQNCGAELQDNPDAKETTTLVAYDNYEFGGEQAKHESPALVCPECGEVTAL